MPENFKKMLFTIAILAVSAPAVANAGGIAVVDINKILENSLAGKSFDQQISAKRKAIQKEIKAKEDALTEEKKKLAESQSKEEKAKFEAKIKEFQKKITEANKDVNQRQASLEKSFLAGGKQIREKIFSIVDNIAEDKGFDAVINKSSVLFVNSSLEITDEVMKQLNSELPQVSIKAD